MKLVNYESQNRLSTINGGVNASSNTMAYGANQEGLSSLSKAMQGLGNTMLQIQQQKETTNVVNAINEYNNAMNDWANNPDYGALNQKGENALSIPMDYQTKEAEVRRQISDKYKFRFQDSLNAFNKAVDSDRTNTINTINKYVRGQFEDSAMKTLDMNIQNIANNAVVNASPDAFNTAMKQVSGSVTAQLSNLGYDMATIDLQVKKAQQNIATTMIEKKITDDDLEGANNIINESAISGLIDEKEIMGYRQKVRTASMVLEASNVNEIDAAIAKRDINDPNLLSDVTNELVASGFGKPKGFSGTPTVQNLQAAIMGQESGGDSSAVNSRTGAYGLFQIMPDNWPQWSAEAGIPGADMTDPEAQKKVAAFKMGEYAKEYGVEGAIIAWYAGPVNGQRWKNGEPDAIGDNGQHYSWDAPQGAGDEPSVRQYLQDVKSRLFNGSTHEETPAELQKRRELAERNVAARIQYAKRRNAQVLENQKIEVEQRVAAAIKNGGTDLDALKIRQDYAETHPEYARAMVGQLNQAQIAVNKAAAKAMQAKEANVFAVKQAIANGQFNTQEELNNFISQMGVYFTSEQYSKINDEFGDYKNGNKHYAPEMQGMKASVESLAGRKIDGIEWKGVATVVYPKVQEYRKEYGEEPSAAQMAEWGAEAVAKQAIASTDTGKFWGAGRMANTFGGRGAAIEYTDAQLAANGMYSLYNTTGADGQPYYVYKDSKGREYTITPEELAERLDQ